jgi:hypothetical protein
MADLAIRLYRGKQGRLPEALSDLVPDYLPSVPIDPYSGQPLVYRPQGESFLLYSVGQDRRDDGGRLPTADESPATSGRDLVLDPPGKPPLPPAVQRRPARVTVWPDAVWRAQVLRA